MSASKELRLLNDKHLECRSYNFHQLERASLVKTPAGIIYRVSLCKRCGVVREDRYTKKGALLGRRYFYPDGYNLEGGRPASEEVMREVLRRAELTTASEEDAKAAAAALLNQRR